MRATEKKKAGMRAYHAAHREQRLTQMSAYKVAHREEMRAKVHAYYLANREQIAASQRAYAATHREEAVARTIAWGRANPVKVAAHHRKRRYGITQDQWDALLAFQDGICIGCDNAPATDVDHDHETGAIRGLLCRSCNVKDALGTAL